MSHFPVRQQHVSFAINRSRVVHARKDSLASSIKANEKQDSRVKHANHSYFTRAGEFLRFFVRVRLMLELFLTRLAEIEN